MEDSRTRAAGRKSSARKWATMAAVFALLAFLTLGHPPSTDSRESHDDAFTEDALLTASADQLESTLITPTLDEPIPRFHNVLWCASFQLAWNEARALIGEDIHLEKDPPLAASLNRIFDKPFLMILQRADAQTPYFALWVRSPELLVAAK